jgi:GTP-binding protein HflX
MWTHFGRQGGTSGAQSNRGVGETQIELDRRHIERRMNELEKELKQVDRERATQREKRLRSGLPRIALVGYTNAGKSTLMNRLLQYSAISPSGKEEKQVVVKDALFVTLDSTVRRISIPDRHPFLLSDTVGFINELPHSLVKAFRSTLEEVKYADILLQVIDVSDPMYEVCEKVTEETLLEIGAGAVPMIKVYNKTDLAYGPGWNPRRNGNSVYLSAAPDNGTSSGDAGGSGKDTDAGGIGLLLDAVEDCLRENRHACVLLLPYKEGAVLQRLQENGDIESSEYLPEGVLVKAVLGKEELGRLKEFLQNGD